MTNEGQSKFIPHSHLPYGEKGTGFYSDNTLGCIDVVSTAQPLVLNALDISLDCSAHVINSQAHYTSLLDRVPIQQGAPLNICDYGTADGGTSISLLWTCVEEIKMKHGQEKEIMVYYEDQTSNDVRSVINRINGLIPGPPSYIRKYTGVHTACVGASFFSRCFPANSIHLGISFSAMQWLSERPGILSDALHHTTSSRMEEIECFKQQASQDWETILLARAHELVPGGQMVIACLAVDKEGQYTGSTKRVKNNVYERMATHWAAMATEGRITQEEFVNTNINNYIRTAEEFSAPFNDPQSKVCQAGLQLVSIDTQLVPCRYHCTWEAVASDMKAEPEAAKAHAKWFIPTTRTWSNSTFWSGLSSSRMEEEKSQLIDEFFTRYEADVASSPGDHAADYIHAYIHIQKST